MVVHHWSDDGMVMYHRRSLFVCYAVCLFVVWFDGYSLKTRDIFSHEIKKVNFIFHLWIVYFVFCICVFWFILFYVLVRKYFLNLYICLESFFSHEIKKVNFIFTSGSLSRTNIESWCHLLISYIIFPYSYQMFMCRYF